MQIILNGETRRVAKGVSTITDLLHELEIPGQQVAVEVNLELIPRKQHQTHVLSEHDQVEVVRLVGGG